MENEQTIPVDTSAAAPELTVTDLQNIRSILDAACRRGTFAAGEMASVGAVYNKLDTFINAVAPKKDEAAQ